MVDASLFGRFRSTGTKVLSDLTQWRRFPRKFLGFLAVKLLTLSEKKSGSKIARTSVSKVSLVGYPTLHDGGMRKSLIFLFFLSFSLSLLDLELGELLRRTV